LIVPTRLASPLLFGMIFPFLRSFYWPQLQVALFLFIISFKKIQLCIICRCGPQPNSKLLLNYGFVDEDNSYDRLVVKVKSGYSLFIFSIILFNFLDIKNKFIVQLC
jgi:hypothetical protein